MTENKRFKQVVDGVKDTRTGRTLTHPLEFTLKLNEINALYDCVFDRNEELEKENEKLKLENKKLQCKYDRQLWLYNGLGCEYDWLKEENEQLKQQFNYIQNSISEHIKHQKTELGQKALQEIIEDYNGWLLRHKEVKE